MNILKSIHNQKKVIWYEIDTYIIKYNNISIKNFEKDKKQLENIFENVKIIPDNRSEYCLRCCGFKKV